MNSKETLMYIAQDYANMLRNRMVVSIDDIEDCGNAPCVVFNFHTDYGTYRLLIRDIDEDDRNTYSDAHMRYANYHAYVLRYVCNQYKEPMKTSQPSRLRGHEPYIIRFNYNDIRFDIAKDVESLHTMCVPKNKKNVTDKEAINEIDRAVGVAYDVRHSIALRMRDMLFEYVKHVKIDKDDQDYLDHINCEPEDSMWDLNSTNAMCRIEDIYYKYFHVDDDRYDP